MLEGKFKDDKTPESEEILLYPGNLGLNGITTSFKNTLKILLKENSNVTIWAPKNYITQKNAFNLYKEFPGINVISSHWQFNGSRIDQFNRCWLLRKHLLFFKKRLRRKMFYEKMKTFSTLKFKKVIHFSGYDWYVNEVLSQFDSEKIIYIHNDLFQEYKYRKNFVKPTLNNSFDKFDKLVFVSKALIDVKPMLKTMKKINISLALLKTPCLILISLKEERILKI